MQKLLTSIFGLVLLSACTTPVEETPIPTESSTNPRAEIASPEAHFAITAAEGSFSSIPSKAPTTWPTPK